MSITSYCQTDHTEPKDIKGPILLKVRFLYLFYYKVGLGAI